MREHRRGTQRPDGLARSLILAAAAAVPGLAAAQTSVQEVPATPGLLDSYSHVVFDFNHKVYELVDGFGAYWSPPATSAADAASSEPSATLAAPSPEPLSTAAKGGNFGNVTVNLVNEPITMLSGVLIGDWGTAWTAAERFGINSTVGILGWYDTATDWGYERQELDFGLVLCAYGIDSGPYLVLPFIGPRTARDAFTDVVLTNAVLWTGTWMLLDPSYGVTTILIAEAIEVVAEISATRQIDSHARTLKFDDYEKMRQQYLESRIARCNQVRGLSTDVATTQAGQPHAITVAAQP